MCLSTLIAPLLTDFQELHLKHQALDALREMSAVLEEQVRLGDKITKKAALAESQRYVLFVPVILITLACYGVAWHTGRSVVAPSAVTSYDYAHRIALVVS